MLSDQLRRRLESLNREPLPAAPAEETRDHRADPPATATAARLQTWGELLARTIGHAPAGAAPPAESTPRLGEDTDHEVENASGKHFRLQRPLGAFWPRSDRLDGCISSLPAADRHAELAACAQRFPADILLLDLETCGFAGSMVFLVGLLWAKRGCWTLDQLLARNYAEERAVLETLWEIAAGHRVLVTFNGKSFDWPMVHDRSTRHLLATTAHPSAVRGPAGTFEPHTVRPQMVHCDLLHHARRRWSRELPNCRLQTLERYICGRRRAGDIEGHAIPAAYHDFVRTGNDHQIRSIMHHNALDLVTLLEVLVELLRE